MTLRMIIAPGIVWRWGWCQPHRQQSGGKVVRRARENGVNYSSVGPTELNGAADGTSNARMRDVCPSTHWPHPSASTTLPSLLGPFSRQAASNFRCAQQSAHRILLPIDPVCPSHFVMGCFQSKPPVDNVTPPAEVSWDGTIRPIRPWKVEPAITSAQLERLRNEFWETRVEGRKEMWQALRFAAEADSEELCNETLKAAGLRPANRKGTMQSMFDERGALYEIPMYALKEPSNLDIEPTQEEFKDAARAVADYVEEHQRSRLRVIRQA